MKELVARLDLVNLMDWFKTTTCKWQNIAHIVNANEHSPMYHAMSQHAKVSGAQFKEISHIYLITCPW